ncbi:MAG: PadR family transcriptional regulator [Richelia sp. RM2_1_2]|nr:PadR family transcriptional regulator [Richelia sp. SM2_1_7]NJM20271.1 PadR family transcriptional regulator [Richelia sp. SM1_7_0]NJN11749.1 PadR family transcriptional regulator [Richelia sp. RM1_1_1]NJO30251.1 PadR family transcriptional regulator [Richelia sp. SL_2_1]NJO58321.1 PadR family transcriptional regulator [Richelia sp. RM2_1_2]
MSLAHTILATLGSESYSGYDLWKKFSQTSRYYWQASQQQIYRELGKLEKDGAITSVLIPQEGRPNKKLYRVTEQGIKTLKTWLVEPSEPMAIREELLVKVIAAKLVPKTVILQEIERHRQIHLQQLSVYQEIEQQEFSDISQLSYERKCLYITLRCGIRYENYRIAWCEEAIALLDGES